MVQPDVFGDFFDKYKNYRDMIGKIKRKSKAHLVVNYDDVEAWEKDTAEKLIKNPDEYLKAFTESTVGVLTPNSKVNIVQVQIKNNPNIINLRLLASKHAFRLITVTGIISQINMPQSRPIKGAWECLKCHKSNMIKYNPAIDKREPPVRCGKDKCKGRRFKFDQQASIWIDSQEVVIQESPESVPAGRVGRPVPVLLLGNLVGSIKAGDRVKLTGIVRLEEPSGKRMPFDLFIEANYIEITNKEAIEIRVTSSEEEKIRELAEDPNIYNQILASIAPIYGHEVIKEALMYQMFGGVAEKRGTVKIRGDIHVLLIGDPSTSKSQLLVAVKNIMPRAMYTSGQGVTGAGLTAAVVYEGNKWSLRAGALPLSDGSIVCIDEIDKIDKDDRSTIHTAMEQQRIPIHKATIHTELNSRCAVLAAANPRSGVYEDSLSVRENLNLPQPLLDRFDFIFIMKDIPDEAKDEEIALYMLGANEMAFKPEIEPELLRKYISLARKIKPKLDSEAVKSIARYYASIRNKGNKDKILITHRQNEAMKRIAQASAKIRLSNVATVEDAERAINIIVSMLELVGVSSGKTKDWNEMIGGKVPKHLRDKENLIRDMMRELKFFSIEELITKTTGIIPENDVRKIFARMNTDGHIFEDSSGVYRLTS